MEEIIETKEMLPAQVVESHTELVGAPKMLFTKEQVELIKRTVAKNATDDELALFMYQAKRTGLDPLAGQIHFVKRKSADGEGKVSIQTAIDGYRLIADRTRCYAGNDDPVFDNEEKPNKATVTVYKIVDGQRCAFTATARWLQYYPGDKQGFMWNKMPHLMLGKCAEALALRKAFPAELSGTYINEEMDQANEVVDDRPAIKQPTAKTAAPAGDFISEAQGKRLFAIWKNAGKANEDVAGYLHDQYGVNSTREIKRADYDSICKWAETKQPEVV